MTLTSSLCLVELLTQACRTYPHHLVLSATSNSGDTILLVLKDVTAASEPPTLELFGYAIALQLICHTSFIIFHRSDDKFFQLFFSYLFFHL